MICKTALFITLSLFGGGKISVHPDQVESFQEDKCLEITESKHWWLSSHWENVPCRLLLLKYGNHAHVMESTDEIKHILEIANGK
jgi:hypothetical protein